MVFGGSGAKPLFPLAAAVAWLRAAKAGPRKGERDKREGCKGRRSEKTAVDEATPSISLPVSLSLSLSLSYLSRRPAYGKEPMLSHCCPLERGVAVRGPERKRPAEKRASLEERLSFFVG
jgi:hypothetical protein